MQSDGLNSALSSVVYCAEYKNKYTNIYTKNTQMLNPNFDLAIVLFNK